MTVHPLPERIETTRQGRDDLYINRKFLDIMEHPDNADIVAKVETVLAINDPVPADEDSRPAEGKTRPPLDDGNGGLVGV